MCLAFLFVHSESSVLSRCTCVLCNIGITFTISLKFQVSFTPVRS